MNAMKTLFEYLLSRGASAGGQCRGFTLTQCTHRNETSADEARVVCY